MTEQRDEAAAADVWTIGKPGHDYELTVQFRLGEYEAYCAIPAARSALRELQSVTLTDAYGNTVTLHGAMRASLEEQE